MNRTRPIIGPMKDFKISLSTKSRATNHYEILNVKQDSTQEDIKSAYYELSKKYHPDVNESVDATRKFQDVSDAYEVLSNFQKRKMYDRDLMARGDSVRSMTTYSTPENDSFSTMFRSRVSNYDHVKNYKTHINFDFEFWTRQHYGQTLRRSLKDKSGKILREHLRREHERQIAENKVTIRVVLFASFVCLFFLSLQSYYDPLNQDKNMILKKKSDKER